MATNNASGNARVGVQAGGSSQHSGGAQVGNCVVCKTTQKMEARGVRVIRSKN